MAGFDPTFDAAGTGNRDGAVPHPGSIDGTAYYMRADKSWAVPRGQPPGPQPPAPGPDQDQWACDIAGYLINEVARVAVKYALDWLPVSWIGDVVGGITVGVLHVLLPEEALLFGALDSAIFTWVSTYVSGHLGDLASALVDDVAWAKLHCALYDKIKLTPTDLRAAILAFAGVIGGLVGWTTPAIAAVVYFLENVGINDVSNIPIQAFVRNYDCSTCSTTGIGPTKPLLQTSFDLTVTDGTNTDTFVDKIKFTNATVAVTGSEVDVTVPPGLAVTDGTTTVTAVDTIQANHSTVSGTTGTATLTPEVGIAHNGTSIGVEPNLDFVDSTNVAWTVTDDPSGHRVLISASDAPTSLGITPAIVKTSTIGTYPLTLASLPANSTYPPSGSGWSGTTYDDSGWSTATLESSAPFFYIASSHEGAYGVVAARFHYALTLGETAALTLKVTADSGWLGVFLNGVQLAGQVINAANVNLTAYIQVPDGLAFVGNNVVTVVWVNDDSGESPSYGGALVDLLQNGVPAGAIGPVGPVGATGSTGATGAAGTAGAPGPGVGYGVLSARPAAGTAGVLYYATDTHTVYRDNGSSWDTLSWDAADIVAGLLATTRGGLGLDSSAFVKGTILAYSGSAWLGDGPGSDGLVLTSDSTQPGGTSWSSPGSIGGSGAVTFDTYGTTTQGGSNDTPGNGAVLLKKITPGSAGYLYLIEIWMKGNGSTVSGIWPVIFDDNSGVPGKIVAINASQGNASFWPSTTYRQLSLPIAYMVTASTPIWIGVMCQAGGAGALSIAYATGGSDYTSTSSGAWAADGANTAPTSGTKNYSIAARVLH